MGDISNPGEVLASAAGAVTRTSADILNYGYRGIVAVMKLSAPAGDDTFALSVEGKDESSGEYYTVASFNAQSAAATYVYEVHPDAAVASGGVTAISNRLIPKIYRVKLTYAQVGGAASNITSQVAVSPVA